MRTNGHTSVVVPKPGKPPRRKDEQLRAILHVLQAVKRGDLDARVPVPEGDETVRQIATEVNELVARLDGVGPDTWRDLSAVSNGERSPEITVDAESEILEPKNTNNRMIQPLQAFASEVTRVARDGKRDEQLRRSVGIVFDVMGASTRTEELLQELQRSNSELERRTRELEEKARELARASKYKSDFLANMSHELRTPLNSLLILASLLAENEGGTLTPQQVEFARTICTSGRDLLTLINEILDLSKIEAGKVEVKTQTVSIAGVTDFVERSFRKIAEHKSLELHIEIAESVPPTLSTDPLRFQQILKNLLSNAFKFTAAGSVSLTIEATTRSMVFGPSADEEGVLLSFAVSDTGIGIAQDKQQIIFEPFHQADASTSRNYGGTGLGLAISRELARLLGGEICLRSTFGNGSTFTLYLPLSPPVYSAPSLPRRSEAPLALSRTAANLLTGRNVLVVDDDVRNAFAIRSLLESRGIQVLLAHGARASLDMLQKHPEIEAVLMDIMMPEIDGYEATRNIRAIEAFRALPIIALTSKAMVGDREKVLDAGCSDFVPKPVDNEQLLGTLSRWFAKPA